ncbi:hypothetical protein [Pseudoalteromonas sp. NEC-BIFX-2020_015]|nr:hypothetical protein [Pseudoalteromonas sp. NEC-BIFX-2020_015]
MSLIIQNNLTEIVKLKTNSKDGTGAATLAPSKQATFKDVPTEMTINKVY